MPERKRRQAPSVVEASWRWAIARGYWVCIVFALFGSRASIAETTDSGKIAGSAFREVFLGGFADLGVGTSQAGNLVLGEEGPRFLGIMSLRRGQWILQWDAFLAGKGGYVKTAGPFTTFLGGRVVTQGEIGYRHLALEHWSPYLGAQARIDAQWLRHPGIPRYALNDMDGISGRNASARVRLDVGVSRLDDAHSLLLVGFIQEVERPTDTKSGVAFTEIGLGARYDISTRLTASLEASWGRAKATRNPALGLSDQTTHKELSTTLRAWFFHRMWLELSGIASRNTDRLVYSGSGTTYDTANVPNLSATLSYGLSLEQ